MKMYPARLCAMLQYATVAAILTTPFAIPAAHAELSSTVLASPAIDQDYLVQVARSARTSSTFLTDFATLRSSISRTGATVNGILSGTSNLYIRFRFPAQTVSGRNASIAELQALPLVTQVISGQASARVITDASKLTVSSATDSISETSLRGFRPKIQQTLPNLNVPHANEILIKYLQSAAYTPALLAEARASLAVTLKQMGASVRQTLATDDTPIDVISLPTNGDYATALLAFQNAPVLEYAQPNYIHKLATTTPNDTAWSGTDYSTTSLNMWDMKDIQMPTAWDTITSASGIIVGICDTGINYNHADLSGNMWSSLGFNEVGGTDPIDDNTGLYHGSHVAGTVGAVGNNSIGISGVAWSTQLMAVKVLDSSGSGTDSTIASGFTDAKNNGAKVLNCSFAEPADSNDYALNSYYDSLASADILVAKAAGNATSNHDSWTYLGNVDSYLLPNMLFVGATDYYDSITYFSDYGQTSVDLFAPGNIIWSVDGSGNSGYKYLSGTSQATPHVAGAAALLRAEFSNESANEIADRIRFSTSYTSGLSSYCWTQGRLNVASALGSRPRLTNTSGLAYVNAAGSITEGFIVRGTSTKQIVLRAQGPNLQNYGYSTYLSDPEIVLYNSSGTAIASNNDWGSLSSSDKSVLSSNGLTPAYSTESALVESLSAGSYTVVLTDTSSSAYGQALMEVYDVDSSATDRLIDLSALGYVGSSVPLTTSFIVTGSFPRTVLIKGWGSSLASYGISGYLSDPEITVYSSGSSIGSNDDWTSSSAALKLRINHCSAGAPGASSDSAVVLRLNPGTYSVQMTGKSGATGTGLISVDEF